MNEIRMQWVNRTWRDVRRGDRVRIGAETAVVLTADCSAWHAHVKWAKTYDAERKAWWDKVQSWPHDEVRVRLDADSVDPEKMFEMRAGGPVDLYLTEDEVTFWNAMGWKNRLYVIRADESS